jgi:hypothetical protein
MFKSFREPNHREYAVDSLEKAKLELLVGLEKLEYYEGWVAAKRKQIARLEETTKEFPNEKTTLKQSTSMFSVFSRSQEPRSADPRLSGF